VVEDERRIPFITNKKEAVFRTKAKFSNIFINITRAACCKPRHNVRDGNRQSRNSSNMEMSLKINNL
jgi:hypothetical protein